MSDDVKIRDLSGEPYKSHREAQAAKARYIEAAPDIVRVARAAVHLCESLLSYREGATDELIIEIRDALKTAIAKAEGK